jgi:exodeoxyribonuclease VII large subunit
VSAVGHEVDFTIADFVADVRAPTPSAAAEIVISAQEELSARLERQQQRLRGAITHGIDRRRARLHVLVSRRGLAMVPAHVAMRGRHAAELTHQLRRAMTALLSRREREFRALRLRLEACDLRRRLTAIRARLESADARLQVVVRRRQDRAQARLGALAARLDSLSPLAVLGRGYAVCWNADRTAIIRRASSVKPGDRISVVLHEGELECQTIETRDGSNN